MHFGPRHLIWFLLVLLGPGCGGTQARLKKQTLNRPPPVELIGVWYTVEAGDTVVQIGKRFSVPFEDLIELNGLVNPDLLLVGQPVFVYGVDRIIKRLSKAHPKKTRNSKAVGSSRFVWPVKGGVLTSGFGPRGRRKHKGIDVATKTGTPIYAVADGTVVYSNNKQRGYGNLIIIRHPGKVLTVYAHNHRNLVDEGDDVRQGAQIAEVGNTGRSTGPHLHFEIRMRGKAVNPLKYLPRQ